MYYRKKPVVIEAMQFIDDTECIMKLHDFMKGKETIVSYENPDALEVLINTLEGVMHASVGDFIIKGVNGEFYPCKPDIFEKTYEKVEM